ncbi:MAG: hypothetical protein OEV55_10485, partial [candidate division Zixibacteria bacterium]|nr:hypothetical protein [candidate division Zixibacteria bacterium]
MKRILFALILVVFIASQGLAQDGFLIKVSPLTPQETNLIKESGVIAIAKTADYYLAEATSENLEYFKSVGISYQVLDDEAEFSLYYFIWAKPGEDISRYLDQIKEKVTVLEAEGSRAIVKGYPKRIEELTSSGLSIKLIKKKPLPIKSEEEYPFTAKAKISAYSPLINQIIQKVTTGKLYDYVADLSGENEVLIGGIPETLLTRYTYTEGCDQAAQYIKEKLESYGLTAWYDTFTIPKKFPGYIRDIISTTDG